MAFVAVGQCFRGPFGPPGSVRSLFTGQRKLGTYLAVGAAVVIGTLKVVAHIKKRNRRKKWNSVGKDKVVLHMFQRGYFCPSLSPFVVKLEMYLKMAKIPYEVDFEEPLGAKGKSPWITLNGEEMADSQLIIEKLGSLYDKNLSEHLTPSEKAVAAAMRIMVEDHFLWCLATWRYVLDGGKTMIASMELPVVFRIMMPLFKGKVQKMMYLQGMGRHTFEEIEEFGRKDLMTLSTWLDNKLYFMGDKPTEVDCAIFGILSQIEWNSPGSPYLRMIKKDFSNLSAYCLRVKDNIWPDWNQCLHQRQA